MQTRGSTSEKTVFDDEFAVQEIGLDGYHGSRPHLNAWSCAWNQASGLGAFQAKSRQILATHQSKQGGNKHGAEEQSWPPQMATGNPNKYSVSAVNNTHAGKWRTPFPPHTRFSIFHRKIHEGKCENVSERMTIPSCGKL